MLAKSIAAECILSRGLLLASAGMFASVGIILVYAFGDTIYDSNKRNPFFLSMGMISVALIFTAIMASFKKLDV